MNGDSWVEMVPAYVLGALDPDERSAFEARLAEDPGLQAEVASYEEVVAGVARAIPQREPPPGLRERILAEASSVRPIRQARADTMDGRGRRGSRSAFIPWLLAAAAVTGAVGMGAAYLASTGREADTLARLESVRQELAQRDSLLSVFLGPRVRTASLAATDQPPSAHLFWNEDARQLMVAAFNLPPAPAGRTYQLWGIQGTQNPVSLGVFQTGADGTAVVVQAVPGTVDFDISAVTEEPAGGSPQPTTTPFLVGSWSQAP